MAQDSSENIFLITSLLVFVLASTIIALFIVFQRRKNKLLNEKEEAQKRYEQEITKAQIEVREETLRNISWELHDNIGQLLTLAKIQLQHATPKTIDEITQTIAKSLEEVRSLSKLISPEFIKNVRLQEAVQLEIERFNRLNYIEASLNVKGQEQVINRKHVTVIFRMLQEFFTNTIKHSKATNLNVTMEFKDDELEIVAKDNGVGFELGNTIKNGIGLQNIKSRADLINAKAKFESEHSKGTTLIINYYI